jgi:hypothetical protein
LGDRPKKGPFDEATDRVPRTHATMKPCVCKGRIVLGHGFLSFECSARTLVSSTDAA